MKADDRIRTIIAEACEQFGEQLAIHIAELVPELVRDHLVATLGNLDASPVTKPRRKPVRRAKVARDLKPAKSPDGKRRNHCRSCGAEGFQTKTCGRTHNVGATPIATVDAPKPPPHQLPGRIGSRESRPQPAREATVSSDADEEPEPMGVTQSPAGRRRRRRRWRARSATIPEKRPRHQAERELDIKIGSPIEFDLDALRPRTRGECVDAPRPCPWVGCSHHLFLDVLVTGSLKLNYPGLELEQLADTCVLDVADRGGITLEATGDLMNLTRERVRQIELKAYAAANANPTMVELRSA